MDLPAVESLGDFTLYPSPSALVLTGLPLLSRWYEDFATGSLLIGSRSGDGVTRRIVLCDVCGRVGEEAKC